MDKQQNQSEGQTEMSEQLEFTSFIKAEKAQIITPELQKMLIKGQVFYDSRQKAFIFREKENVVFVQAGDQKKIFSFKIPYEQSILQGLINGSAYLIVRKLNIIFYTKRKNIYAMSLHQSNKYIAYSIADNTLVILNLADGKREQRIKMSSNDSSQKILHFSWVYQRPSERNIDFILCEKSGVRLYKILDEKCILKEQKYYEINCCAAWYEYVNQVLLVASLKENGKLYTFFFGEKKSQLKYRGPEFYLEDNKREKRSTDIFMTLLHSIQEMDRQEGQSNGNSGTQISQGIDTLITKSQKTQIYYEECNSQLFLLNIYSKTYLIFANQMDGKILIYHLLYEKILCLDWKISIPSDSLISLCVVEDLLLVNSNQNQISMIYDIKRQIPTTPLGPPQPIYIKPYTKTLYEKPIICLGDEWVIDLDKVEIYRFKVELQMIHSMIEGDLECFNIILRRDDPKQEAIDFIKTRIKSQKEINHISIYFKHIFEIYKEAQKDTVSIDTNSSTVIQDTIKIANKTKIKQGYTIIFPSDLHQELLVPIVQDKSISRQYITDILSEYLRLAYNNGIIQLIKTQELLIDVVLKEKNFNTLHFLIQYKILSDTSELAKKLINMSCPVRIQKLDLPRNTQVYRPGFQLGIDMLFRLKKLYDIVEIFFQFGMFLEALDLIQRNHVYKIKARNIAAWASEYQGNCSRKDVFRFFEYLLSCQTYINYQNSNSSSSSSSSHSNSSSQQNKISFTLTNLNEEFKKAKEKLDLIRNNNSEKSKSKEYVSVDDIISPIKSSNQNYRRVQTSAAKTEESDSLRHNSDQSQFQHSKTLKESESNEIQSQTTDILFQGEQSLQSQQPVNYINPIEKTNIEEEEKETNNQNDEDYQLKLFKQCSNDFIEDEEKRDESQQVQVINQLNEENLI